MAKIAIGETTMNTEGVDPETGLYIVETLYTGLVIASCLRGRWKITITQTELDSTEIISFTPIHLKHT